MKLAYDTTLKLKYQALPLPNSWICVQNKYVELS